MNNRRAWIPGIFRRINAKSIALAVVAWAAVTASQFVSATASDHQSQSDAPLVADKVLINEVNPALGPDPLQAVIEPDFEHYLQDAVRDLRFSGGVLVARDGRTVHAQGYGPASAALANNANTAFHVASVTKQFTAAAIMHLAEADLLIIERSINDYLPQQYRTPRWDAVTVHHLLSHSSGIPDYAVTRDYYEVVDGFASADTVDGMIREAMSEDLEFSPGTEYAYSNIGYTLLGEIIENQSSTSYEAYLKENVLDPLSMSFSRARAESHVPGKNEAEGHRWSTEKSAFTADDIVSLPATAPDGGLITTLNDFHAWTRIFAGGNQQILTQESIDRMTTAQVSIGRGGPLDAYGYGLYVGDRLIGHGGYVVGFRSQFVYDRPTDTTIAVFTNNTSNDPQQIVFGLLTIVMQNLAD